MQAGDSIDEVFKGAAEAIQLPDDEGVARPCVGQTSDRPLRSSLVPLAVSWKTRSHPAFSSASCWRCIFWSAVETRAYPMRTSPPVAELSAAAQF
jgi:hypothetical protein